MRIFNIYSFKNAEDGVRLWYENAEGYLHMVTDSSKHFEQVRDAVRETKAGLNRAKELAEQGDKGAAIKIWKDQFARNFPTVDVNEARSFGQAICDGGLKWSAAAGLSTTVGKVLAASKGFYGENESTAPGE